MQRGEESSPRNRTDEKEDAVENTDMLIELHADQSQSQSEERPRTITRTALSDHRG